MPTDDEQHWRDVVQARAEFLAYQFGPLPDEIQTLRNLAGIWPGGGIYQLAAPRLAGMGVCITHGLTNADMPARLRPAESDEGGLSVALVPRPPREVPPGLAGYGYELAVLTPHPDPWPLLSLSWFVQMEILNDLALLDHVAAGNGVVVEGVKFGDGSEQTHFLVQPACAPVLTRVDLPNGLMHLLIATRVTQDEMEFARDSEDGRFVLLNKLVDAGIGPVSRLDRPSVLTKG